MSICRTCLIEDPNILPLSPVIEILLRDLIPHGFQVLLEDDFLPFGICLYCRMMIIKIDRFKKQVAKATKVLQNSSLEDFRGSIRTKRKEINCPTLSKSKTKIVDSTKLEKKSETNIYEPKTAYLKEPIKLWLGKEEVIIKTEPEFDIFDEIPLIKRNEEETEEEKNSISKKRKKETDSIHEKQVKKTKEYIVIKLSRDEVLKEMESMSKNEPFLSSQFKCSFCVKVFMSDDVLQSHLQKHEKNSPYECDICHQFLSSEGSLYRHIKCHSTKYKCSSCPVFRASRLRIVEHYALEHGGNPKIHSCEVCNRKFVHRNMLQKHVRIHFDSAKIPCEKCGKVFKSMDTLRSHKLRYHTKVKQYSCDQCPKSFIYASLLKTHQNTHLTSRDFYCVECNLNFKTHSTLSHHLQNNANHIDPKKLKFECEHCEKRFPTEDKLQKHSEKVHRPDKNIRCEICNIQFISIDNLQFHERKNHVVGEKLAKIYTCTVCGKAFGMKHQLISHSRVHTGEKPFECSICRKKFTQKSSMTTHIKIIHQEISDRSSEEFKPVNHFEEEKISEDRSSNNIVIFTLPNC